MREADTDSSAFSEHELRLLESKALHTRIRAVTTLGESVRNKALRLRSDDGDFVLTANIRGNSPTVEAALLRRLAPVLPVPKPVYADDGELLGRPFVVKRFVPGQTLGSVLVDASPDDVSVIATAVGGALAAIGTVSFDRPGQFTDIDLVPHPHPDFDPMALPEHVARRLDEPVRTGYLNAADGARLLDIVARDAALLAPVRTEARLVHSDFNGKNIVVRRDNGQWRVGAVLDWEFSFSGPHLVDIANHLRFPEQLSDSYRDHFLAGFREAGGTLEADWERIARIADMFALVDFLAAGPQHMWFASTLRRMREIVARGYI